jgi:hypothetical protein
MVFAQSTLAASSGSGPATMFIRHLRISNQQIVNILALLSNS